MKKVGEVYQDKLTGKTFIKENPTNRFERNRILFESIKDELNESDAFECIGIFDVNDDDKKDKEFKSIVDGQLRNVQTHKIVKKLFEFLEQKDDTDKYYEITLKIIPND